MRIYLSGPISGHDDFMKEFQRKTAGLNTFGCDVINPAPSVIVCHQTQAMKST